MASGNAGRIVYYKPCRASLFSNVDVAFIAAVGEMSQASLPITQESLRIKHHHQGEFHL